MQRWPEGSDSRAQSCMHAGMHSLIQLSATPWSVAHQAPLSMDFSRQEHWGGLPFPPPGDLPDRGIKPRSPRIDGQVLYHWTTWEALKRSTASPLIFSILSLRTCLSADGSSVNKTWHDIAHGRLPLSFLSIWQLRRWNKERSVTSGLHLWNHSAGSIV